VRELVALFRRAGVDCSGVDNLDEARWRKLVWNVPFNGLTIVAGGVPTTGFWLRPNSSGRRGL